MNNAWNNSEVDMFLGIERANNDVIAFKTIYVDMAGDTLGGLVLSQIVFWHTPDKEGNSKLKANHDNYLWLAASHKDWYAKTRLTGRQVDRILNILVAKNLIIKRIYKFSGAPTTHIRINWEVFISVYKGLLNNTNTLNEFHSEVKSISPTGEILGNNLQVKSITETTKETTKKNTKKEKPLSPVGEAVSAEIVQPLEAKNQPIADNVKTPSKANDYQLMIRAIMYMLSKPDSRRHIDYSNPSAQGLAKSIEPQLTGRSKKAGRAEYNLDTPMTPVEVIDFAKWYENQARLLEWKQLHPPMTASILHDRVLEYRQTPRYPEHLERAQGILDKLAVVGDTKQEAVTPETTLSPVPSVEPEQPKYVPAEKIDALIASLKAKITS